VGCPALDTARAKIYSDRSEHVEADNAMQATSGADVTPSITEATLIWRSPAVLAAEADGEIVMMSIEHGRYFGLDDIGSDIWKRIEQPCSFAALVDALAADYEAERGNIAADVTALLGQMAEQDAVRLA
jgi:hypothetical protein